MIGKNKPVQETPVEKAGVNSGGRVKHVPMRTCVICREKAGKRILTRIVRTPDGVMVDSSGKMNGRGAYLCEQESCWKKAVTTDLLAKSLKTTLSAEDRERLNQAKRTS